MNSLLFALCPLLGLTTAPTLALQDRPDADDPYQPTWESLDSRPTPDWFNEAKFGVFICWGPYSVPAWAPKGQYAEWYGHRMRREGSATKQFHERVYGPDFVYEDFGPLLTGELFDADRWADVIARSGAKYIALTANYHDGFALFPSPYSPGWNSADTGPGRDVLAEVSAAVEKRGVRFGIYYSLYEWFHPLWVDPATRPRFVEEHYIPQLKEVVTRYRPAFIFADGEWEGDEELWRSAEVLAWLFNESPRKQELVVNDRFGGGRSQHGTVYSSEYGGGNYPPTHPWEENRGIGKSYGYNRNEDLADYDSLAELLQMLCKIAGNGGNFLLDIGPTADGRIPVIMEERLLQIGEWLAVNGEAIYGSEASPFWPRRFDWGTCTHQPAREGLGTGERLFVIVHGAGGETILLPGLKNSVAAARLLAGDEPVAATPTVHGTLLELPAAPADGLPWIVALELDGPPEVDPSIHPDAEGSFPLRALEAQIHGSSPRYESGGGKDNIGYWGNPEDYVSWQFQVHEPGRFEVLVTYSCAVGFGGSGYAVSVGQRSLAGTTKETGAWSRFETESLGQLTLEKAGRHTLHVRPVTPPAWKAMGLKEVRLRPVDSTDR